LAAQRRFESLTHRRALAQQQRVLDQMLPHRVLAVDGEPVAMAHEKTQVSARAQPRHLTRVHHGAKVLLMGLKLLIHLPQRSARVGPLLVLHQSEQVGLLNARRLLVVSGIFGFHEIYIHCVLLSAGILAF